MPAPKPDRAQTKAGWANAKPVAETGKPTIRDVARIAGVGIGSVSRVVNKKSTVAPRIRIAVERAIAEIGYEPDALASSMRRLDTRTVGCIIRDATMPGFGLFLTAAEATFRKAGYTMLLANPEGRKDVELGLLRTFSQRRTDGILMTISDEGDSDLQEAMDRSKMAIVLVNRDPAFGNERLLVDHRAGVAQATRYLISLGHRRIGLMTSEMSIYPGRSRVQGFVEAFRQAGLDPPMDLVRNRSSATVPNTREVMELLTSDPAPTALITGGRSLLVETLRAARQSNLRIGVDLSLVCDSDSELAELATPAITAIRWDIAKMGQIAAEMLLERLASGAETRGRKVIMDTELVLRESCAQSVL